MILRLPMPPTANRQVMPFRGRLIKTKMARDYDKAIDAWISQNKLTVEMARDFFVREVNQGMMLKVDCYFAWPKSDLISKKNTLKKVDANNRLKSTLDALAKIINVDDKYYTTGACEKCLTLSEEKEVLIKIQIVSKIRSLSEILDTL